MINHNWDTFLIWLNPMALVWGDSDVPQYWYIGVLPIVNLGSEAWVVMVPAQDMEAAPAGVTERNPTGAAGVSTVAVSTLEPGEGGSSDSTYFVPGLAKICANQTIYQAQLAYDIANPTTANQGQYCTQANQCGCTPADFLTILKTDLLLNINPSTYQPYSTTPTGYSGPTDPTTLDGSGHTVCIKSSIPNGSDCRYIPVPLASIPSLSGSGQFSETVTDGTSSALTTTASESETDAEDLSLGVFFSLKFSDSWTWTNTEGVTHTNGASNAMQVTLKTKTTACGSEPVTFYEDTIFHTFAFVVPDDWSSVCP